MKQRNLFGDADAKAAVEAEQETISRPVSDILAAWRRAYLAEYERKKVAGELPPHIYENIRRIEELKAERDGR